MANVSVKIDEKVVAKVKAIKKKSGINVGKFFELAAYEKIENDKKGSLTYEDLKQIAEKMKPYDTLKNNSPLTQ